MLTSPPLILASFVTIVQYQNHEIDIGTAMDLTQISSVTLSLFCVCVFMVLCNFITCAYSCSLSCRKFKEWIIPISIISTSLDLKYLFKNEKLGLLPENIQSHATERGKPLDSRNKYNWVIVSPLSFLTCSNTSKRAGISGPRQDALCLCGWEDDRWSQETKRLCCAHL